MSLGYIVSIEIKETKTCKSNIKTWNIGKHENCRIGCCQWQRTCVISKRDNTGHVRGELFEGRLLLGVRGQSLGLPNQLNYLRCALPIWKIISSYLILNSETRIDCRYHPPPRKKTPSEFMNGLLSKWSIDDTGIYFYHLSNTYEYSK